MDPSFLPPLDLFQTLVSSSCLATGPLATRLELALVVAVRTAEAALTALEVAAAAPFTAIFPYRGYRNMKLCAIMTC
jgi:hypothetical protein